MGGMSEFKEKMRSYPSKRYVYLRQKKREKIALVSSNLSIAYQRYVRKWFGKNIEGEF